MKTKRMSPLSPAGDRRQTVPSSSLPQGNFQSTVKIEGGTWRLEGRGADRDIVIICAVGRTEWLGHKMIVVIEGRCAQLRAGGEGLFEKMFLRHNRGTRTG